MQGDDLAIFGILWGTAISCALAAVTMIDSGRKRLLTGLWIAAGVFMVVAMLWPWIAETWPKAKAVGQYLSANLLAMNLLGITIFGLLAWDFRTRHRWLEGNRSGPELARLANAIEQLKGRVSAIEETGGTTRDIRQLFYFALSQSAAHLLDSILEQAPVDGNDSPLMLGDDFVLQIEREAKFIELAKRKLDNGAERRRKLLGILMNAEAFAEHEIESIPMEQRPSGIDPLAIRKWAITHRQCTRTVAYLQHERREIQETLLSQRHGLLERYSQLDKS